MNKRYNSAEVAAAFNRWKQMHGGEADSYILLDENYDNFLKYLGMLTFVKSEPTSYPLPPFSIGIPSTAKKLDALLSPHWYALTKAYLAMEAK